MQKPFEALSMDEAAAALMEIPEPADPTRKALTDLLDAVMGADVWRECEAGHGGSGPIVMAFDALGKPLPPEVDNWLSTSDEAKD